MKLYIETENGAIKNHPAFEDNLLQAFGSIPAHWEPFNRVERPTPGVYQVLESTEAVYAKVDGVWTDVWSMRDMTTEEKTAKQQAVITMFNNREYDMTLFVHIYVCTYTPACTCTYTCTCLYTYKYKYAYAYVHTCMYIYIYMHMFIYI
jgi:hypothetical protein